MDPVTLTLLATAIIGVVTELAKTAAGHGAELLLDAGADEARARDELRAALQAALAEIAQDSALYALWYDTFPKLQHDHALTRQLAAATVGMVTAQPERVPAGLLAAMGLPETQRPTVARFLFRLREGLSGASQYRDRIAYANDLHRSGQLEAMLAGITRLGAAVADTPTGPAVRVAEVSPYSETAYLERLAERFAHLDLFRRADNVVGQPVSLAQVYIALDTTETRTVPRHAKSSETLMVVPDSALRAVDTHQHLSLVGDPGSGKSTFVQHLCLALANARLGRPGAAELARDTASLPTGPAPGRFDHLLAFIGRDLARHCGSERFMEPLRAALESGEALVVLDGLDEVTHPEPDERDPIYSDQQRRLQVIEAIHSLARKFPKANVLVTCRVRVFPVDAQGKPLLGFRTVTLRPFGPEQIEAFITRWFHEMKAAKRLPGEPEPYIASLRTAIATREQLDELAQQPFLLTQMALLVGRSQKLPDERVDLYEECARYLLWEWEDLKAAQTERDPSHTFIQNLGVPGLKRDDVQTALDVAAWQAFRAGQTELPEAHLRDHLSRKFLSVHPDMSLQRAESLAARFIDQWLLDRNGLYRSAGERRFEFPHRSFYEFITARCLVKNEDPEADDWQAELPRLATAGTAYWREVMRFAASYARNPKRVAEALDELCPEALAPESGARVLLAGRVLADVGAAKVTEQRLGKAVYTRLEPQLINLMRDSAGAYGVDAPHDPAGFAPADRLEAGRLLERLGWTPPDLYDLIAIEGELPPDRAVPSAEGVGLLRRFFIAKYAVTNAQYERFLNSVEYKQPAFWETLTACDETQRTVISMGPRARDWFLGNGGPERRPGLWEHSDFGQSRRLAPVVGVSWYEAAAYCAWLTARLRQREDSVPEVKGLLAAAPDPQAYLFRLPIEAEWEPAAGGLWRGAAINEPPRYPWQSGPGAVTPNDIQRYANTSESGLGQTTPACTYPAGASQPHGVMDLAGNVWEWLANFYDKDRDRISARGGSWNIDLDDARVALRGWGSPDFDWSSQGFRVVAAPISR